MKTILLVLLPILSWAQIDKKFTDMFKVSTGADGKTSVIFSKTNEYQLEYTQLTAWEDFTDVEEVNLSGGFRKRVDNVAMFYWIGKDTVSLTVISPLSDDRYPVVAINGMDLRTGDMLPTSLWRYNEIIEIVRDDP
jgi:hypothetical protein